MRHPGISSAVASAAVALACLGPLTGAAGASDFPVIVDSADQSRADAASAGDTLLVVWQDSSGTDIDIRAARVTSAGTLIAPGAFDVCAEAGDQSWPAVASDGTDFLVVWQDERSGSAEVWAARVTAGGSVTDAGGFQVSDGSGEEKYPDVAWTGSAYAVAWQDSRGADWDVLLARVGTDGVVQEPGALAIKVTGAGTQDDAAVAGSGGDALVVYRDGGGDVKGAIVDAAGTASAPFGIATLAGTTQKSPAVAFGGGVYLVAWEDYRDCQATPLYQDVYAARVTPAGAVLDAAPHAPVAKASDGRSAAPSVAFDGANFVVAWEDGPDGARDIYTARVLADAGEITVRETGGLAVSPNVADQAAPSAARAGAGVLVAWVDSRGAEPGDVYASRLGTNDPPLAEAGTGMSVPPAADVTLDGSGSFDPEGLAVTYDWHQVGGGGVSLTGSDTSMPTFTAPGTEDTLTFELEVSDGAQAVTDQVVVTVASSAPDPPQPTDVQAASAGAATASVTWLTAPDAVGSVRWGATPALGIESAQEPALTETHDILLGGLTEGATYYYAVRSEGAEGAWTLSSVESFVHEAPIAPLGISSGGCRASAVGGARILAAALALAGAVVVLRRRHLARSP